MLIWKKRELEFSVQSDWKIPAEPINEVQVLLCSKVELIIFIMSQLRLAASSEKPQKKKKKRWKNGAVHIRKISFSLILLKSTS